MSLWHFLHLLSLFCSSSVPITLSSSLFYSSWSSALKLVLSYYVFSLLFSLLVYTHKHINRTYEFTSVRLLCMFPGLTT